MAGLAVFLTPLAEFNHLSAGNFAGLRLGLEGIGRQFDFCAMGTELGDGPGMALISRNRELEVIHTGQAFVAIGIGDQADFFECHVFIQQLDIEILAVLFDALQRPLA